MSPEETRAALLDYIQETFVPRDRDLEAIRVRSLEAGLPQIHVAPEEGYLLTLLMRLISARHVLEIGTLAGYSGACIARALPPDGRLITLEYNPAHAAFAAETFARLGLSDRVEIRLGSALESLQAIAMDFDAIFLDADRLSYLDYLDWAIEHLRPGGLLLAHNAFLRGRLVSPEQQADREVMTIQAMHRRIAADARLMGLILPLGDGLTTAVRLH